MYGIERDAFPGDREEDLRSAQKIYPRTMSPEIRSLRRFQQSIGASRSPDHGSFLHRGKGIFPSLRQDGLR